MNNWEICCYLSSPGGRVGLKYFSLSVSRFLAGAGVGAGAGAGAGAGGPLLQNYNGE